jgi:hypothetical protein
MLKEPTAKIYFRIHVFGSGFQQFGHLHSVGLVDFNWAEAWVIVNEHLLDTPVSLFDSCWFKLEIFKKVPNPLNSSSFEANPDHQIQEPSKPEISHVPTLHTRFMGNQLSSKTSLALRS